MWVHKYIMHFQMYLLFLKSQIFITVVFIITHVRLNLRWLTHDLHFLVFRQHILFYININMFSLSISLNSYRITCTVSDFMCSVYLFQSCHGKYEQGYSNQYAINRQTSMWSVENQQISFTIFIVIILGWF